MRGAVKTVNVALHAPRTTPTMSDAPPEDAAAPVFKPSAQKFPEAQIDDEEPADDAATAARRASNSLELMRDLAAAAAVEGRTLEPRSDQDLEAAAAAGRADPRSTRPSSQPTDGGADPNMLRYTRPVRKEGGGGGGGSSGGGGTVQRRRRRPARTGM